MASALDSTHTVVVKSENRGLGVVVGGLAIFLWGLWWWTGSLAGVVAFFVPASVKEGEYGSVTGTVLPIAIDLLWFIGSVIIFAVSKCWAVIYDVLAGVFETVKLYASRSKAEKIATTAAVNAATEAASVAAGATSGAVAMTAAASGPAWVQVAQEASPEPLAHASAPQRTVSLEKVGAAVLELDTRLASLERDSAARAAEILTLSDRAGEQATQLEVHADLLRIDEAKLNAAGAALSSLNERLLKLELPKPKARKVTRQPPAKSAKKPA